MSEEYLPIGQAARLLGVSPFLLRRRIAAGELATFEHPLDKRVRLVARRDLERYPSPRPLPPRRGEVPTTAA